MISLVNSLKTEVFGLWRWCSLTKVQWGKKLKESEQIIWIGRSI